MRTIYTLRVWKLIALLAIATTASSALLCQQKKWSVLLGGGPAFPLTPEKFKSWWETGYNVSIEANYTTSALLTVGASLEYDHFPQSPLCVTGVDRDFISFTLVSKVYLMNIRTSRIYSSGHLGFVNDDMGNPTRTAVGYTYSTGEQSSINPIISLRAGYEASFTNSIGILAEGGYSFTISAFETQSFALARVALIFRW